jgi:RHS repeat-associated protein
VVGRVDTNVVAAYLPATNSFSYDGNGNLLSDGLRYFVYDDENQLISVWVTNTWRSDFVYDGRMRRRIRKEFTWQASITNWIETSEVRYVYDGNAVVQERDINNLPTVSYTRGRDLSGSLQGAGGIGGLLARTDHSILNSQSSSANVHAFYHADPNGNITALINGAQILVAKYEYDPFGAILSSCGSLADANLYRFSSKEFHPNSGLVYYLRRFYDSNLQRWLNRDPFGEESGFNLYTCVQNDPVLFVDAFGLWTWTQTVGVGRALGGVFEVGLGYGFATASVAFGAATSWTGVGAVVGAGGFVGGVAVGIHGYDQVLTGISQAFSGDQETSTTSQLLQQAGMSPTAANMTDSAISVVGSCGAGLATAGVKLATVAVTDPLAAGLNPWQLFWQTESGSRALLSDDFEALGGNATTPLQKAQMIANGVDALGNPYQISTTTAQSMAIALTLLETGPTPGGNIMVGITGGLVSGSAADANTVR